MRNGTQPPAAGEGFAASEHISAEVIKLRDDLSTVQAQATIALAEIRQRPTKTQVVLGAATVIVAAATPAAIIFTALVTYLAGHIHPPLQP